MNTYVIIGAPGQGKSEFVKKAIEDTSTGKKRRCFVFDVQNEYGARTKYKGQKPLYLSDNPNAERARYVGTSMETFMSYCKQKRDTILVFEEATMFFEGRTGRQVRELMIGKRHSGNSLMFLFHSINSVPPRIMEMCDYVVLYKTNDEEHTVQWKYTRLYSYFLHLRECPQGENVIIRMI